MAKSRLLLPTTPVFGPTELLSENYDQKRVLEALQDPIGRFTDPYCIAWKRAINETLTPYLQHGIVTKDGKVDINESCRQLSLRETTPLGVITPDKTPTFFRDVTILEGTHNYLPDTSFNDWITSRKMVNEIESRAEWDARFTFGAMKKTGKVQYGRLAESDRSITNAEYGAGMAFSWTWLETNMFNIEFASLAAKIKFESVELIADEIYAAVVTEFTNTVASQSNVIIEALNQADLQLRRAANAFERYPFANARLRILAPPEMQPYLDIISNTSEQSMVAPQHPLRRYPVTYTTKLSAGTASARVIYVVVDKWETNELGTRIPLTAYGPEDDINSFASNISYRMAFGTSLDTDSAIKLTFDTTADTFSVYTIPVMKAV